MPGELPPQMRVYAVGDLHGCAVHLEKLLAQIEADAAGYDGCKVLLYVGDYIDRGLASRQVIERVAADREGWETKRLLGNHDKELRDFLAGVESDQIKGWLFMHGGQATLASYGVLARPTQSLRAIRTALMEVFPQEHQDFLEGLEEHVVLGSYLFVHGGVRPGVPLEGQVLDDLLYLRPPAFERHGLPYRIVFGHTIMSAPLVEDERIGIDTGAYTGGPLTCAVLEGANVRFLQATV